MDVAELRSAMLASVSIASEIRAFRRERLSLIEKNEGATSLPSTVTAVLHIVPLSSFTTKIDLQLGEYVSGLTPPLGSSGWHTRYTLEGKVTYIVDLDDAGVSSSYALFFRSGIIEVAFSIAAELGEDGSPYIPASMLEWPIVQNFPGYLERLNEFEIQPPYYVFLSILRIDGYYFIAGNRGLSRQSTKCNRKEFILPEVVVTDALVGAVKYLKPAFDMVWNGFGFPKALTFDNEGNYAGQRW